MVLYLDRLNKIPLRYKNILKYYNERPKDSKDALYPQSINICYQTANKKEAPSSYLPDKSGDWSRGKGDGPKDGNQTVVIIGTVLITLAVVASLVGAVIVVKMIRKRSHTTNPANSFSRMNDSHDGDNFDSIALEQNYSNGREQQAVWGDVVELRKVPK